MTEQRTDHKRRFISRYSQEEMSFYIETTLDEKKNDNIGSGRNKRTSKHDRDICAALAKTSFQKKKKRNRTKL